MCPNGRHSDDIGAFNIGLKLISMPTAWKSVVIRSKICILGADTMPILGFTVYCKANDIFNVGYTSTLNEVM